MLFHSYPFIFLFLPSVVFGFALLQRFTKTNSTPLLLWLCGASWIFYGLLSLNHLLLLLISISINYGLIVLLNNPDSTYTTWQRNILLALGVVGNVSFLFAFKYVNFFISNINAFLIQDLPFVDVLFPVGISFYTFIQIGCLIDAYNKQVAQLTFPRFILFGTFFPYITAGPLVLQREMFAQMENLHSRKLNSSAIVVGLTCFFMGLFKKVVLADNIALYANTVYGAAATNTEFGFSAAWLGTFAYTLQLYFDFSGYCDMASGLGYLFGLRLPLNFNAPLRASNIIDFWRRWHITMTRFFTNYIYTPLATQAMRRSIQRRHSKFRRLLIVVVLPVILTFTVAGFWHGPAWGFIIFGLIHGFALAVNHLWKEYRQALNLPHLPEMVGWVLTQLTFVISLVFFRADSVTSAAAVLRAMVGAGQPSELLTDMLLWQVVPPVISLLVLASIALLVPEPLAILRHQHVVLDDVDVSAPLHLTWHPSLWWLIAVSLLALLSLSFLGERSPFLYYQF